MNKKIVILIILCVVFSVKTYTQTTSTAEDPKWFFIQVKGTGTNTNRVITETDGQISGEAKRQTGLSGINQQLWRFEVRSSASGSAYAIINKSSGKKLDVAYDAAKAIRKAVAVEIPSTNWKISKSSNTYTMSIETQPSEGKAGEIYLTQDSTALFPLKLATSGNNENAKFVFYSVNVPVVSTDTEIAWLTIQNEKTDLNGQVVTDVALAGQPKAVFSMEARMDNNKAQQWKIVRNTTDNTLVDFVNRASGSVIGTTPVYDLYYYVQSAANLQASASWRIHELTLANQYEIGTGAVNAESFWCAANETDYPTAYMNHLDKEAGFIWTFNLVDEEILTGQAIHRPGLPENVKVYSRDGYIRVEGADQFDVRNLYGVRVATDRALPAGVYLVTVQGQTVKVLVK
jgi:hypothetical protein